MKNIVCLILLLLFFACTKKEFYTVELINELSKGDFIIPSVYGNLTLFVCIDDEFVASTNINLLHTMYVNDYSNKYNNFSSFLFNALNQNLRFDKEYIEKRNGSVFRVNEEIKSYYEKRGLNDLIGYYCVKTNAGYKISNSLHADKKFTVLYYLSINGYKILEDDYLGAYYVQPF